jgi:hypothetical protein
MMGRSDFFTGDAGNPTFVAFQVRMIFFVVDRRLHRVNVRVVDHPATLRKRIEVEWSQKMMEGEGKKTLWTMPEDKVHDGENMKDHP